MISTAKICVGLLMTALLLILFVATTDIGYMAKAIINANYFFLIPAIAAYFVSLFFRTLRWSFLLNPLKPIKVISLYPIVVIGYMANNLLPMRLGELVRSYYVSEQEGISKTSALATILVERILDAFTLLFFMLIISFFMPLDRLANSLIGLPGIHLPWLIIAICTPFFTMLGVLILFVVFPSKTHDLAVVAANFAPFKTRSKIMTVIDLFISGLTVLRNPRRLSIVVLLSIPVWIMESALFFFVGFAFGFDGIYETITDLSIASILVTAIANIGSSVPLTPGGIGLFEILTRETLVHLPMAAIDRSTAAAFATVTHALLLLPTIFLGQLFLWYKHIQLRSLFVSKQDKDIALNQSICNINKYATKKPTNGETQ